jgi:tetratricopeptide (TPR) repeat protein
MKRLLILAGMVLGAAAPPPAPPLTAIDKLLAALKAAPDSEAAAVIEAKLQDAWQDQATPAVQVLVDHAALSAQAGKFQDALADTEAAVVLQPDLADLYRRRAEDRFALNDDRGAFADLAQALTRDPRLIPAWADLSRFAEARKDNKRALEAWRKVVELDPKGEGAQKRLEKLRHVVNGEPI